jgi:hypothetical protein
MRLHRHRKTEGIRAAGTLRRQESLASAAWRTLA